jgi:ring-1,2-phenylacetyl-CoA epoxidase subunit PaaC
VSRAPESLWVLLGAWADDEFLLGHQLGDLVGSYFDLEEAVALGSLAQDHLVHAQELYSMAGVPDEALDRHVFEREPGAFRSSQLAEALVTDDFAAVVMKMALYSAAEEIRVGRAMAAGSELGSLAARIDHEERYHREHWWDWVTILARTPEGRHRLQSAAERLLPLGADFFDTGNGTDLEVLLPLDQCPGPPAAQWYEAISDRFGPVGLSVPPPPAVAISSGRRGEHGLDLGDSLAALRAVRGPGRQETTWG